MQFEWDETKAERNLAKHGVGFDLVRRFNFETALRKRDARYDYGEDRYRSFGFIGDRLYVLVYTDREEGIRVISLRKANARERANYDRR